MKHLIALGFAMLCAMPVAAQAQDVSGWHFASPNDDHECYAFTKDSLSVGFQAPNGNRVGALVLMAPAAVSEIQGDAIFTIDAPGPLKGDHVAKADADTRVSLFFVRVEPFDNLNTLPDTWHLTVRKGGQKIADLNVTNFQAALTAVRKCMAGR